MIDDLEMAVLTAIKEKKASYVEALDKLGVTGKQAVEALMSLSDEAERLSSLQWLGICDFVLTFTIKSMEDKKYSRVLLGLEAMSICLRERNKTDTFKEFMTEFGKANALKRHAETYQLKNAVIKHWIDNIEPSLSNEKAAEILKKHFPLSHRKLSAYVAEAKRK